MTGNSFGSRATLTAGQSSYEIHRLDAVDGAADLPFSLKVLLENLLRTEDGVNVTADHVTALAQWDPTAEPATEIPFSPARVILQDLTGVPAVVDLATMREAMQALGGDPAMINPLVPAELVIDHSVIADVFGRPDAFERNVELEFHRNRERFQFLRWGQDALRQFKVVPPGTGIVHQVNIEYLARVVMTAGDGTPAAYPDTCVGTDSHTTMQNGLGVLGWGVGGIEAEAAMLGQPISMLIPRVVGFRLTGELPAGTTATDLVLTITELLRKHGVVGKFVEFYGDGVAAVPLANRATIGNMSPEFGSTCAIFPIDEETLTYLRLTGRPEQQVALIEAYAKEQGLWHQPGSPARYSEQLTLDLGTVVPSLAGPKRPQDRVALTDAKNAFREALGSYVSAPSLDNGLAGTFPASDPVASEPASGPSSPVPVTLDDGTEVTIDHGAVVIAAITSCTNTSNPSVMVGAALLAKKAVEAGLSRKPWVKTTLAPGSKVVMDYYERAGLTPYLEKLGFNLVGYGCTTCIGNSGPLPEAVSAAVAEHDLAVVSVLSGNRNFEGRINPDVKMNYLASPPLVVAYALAGTMDLDLTTQPLGTGTDGTAVYLADIWPSAEEIAEIVHGAVAAEMFTRDYADVYHGGDQWRELDVPAGDTFAWDSDSTYVRRPPYFDGMPAEPEPVTDIHGARVLAKLGDSVTTDHISPAGAIKTDSPAGKYLSGHGVERRDFNTYGSRRGNHEVMIRGTFANIRLRNQLAPGTEGGVTVKLPDGDTTSIYEASVRYAQEGTPLIVLGGKEYGSGSSRDWAAKGTALLGVRAVLVESFERIHRSNLIGMGVLPLQFKPGESAGSLGLTGHEVFDVTGIEELNEGRTPREVTVRAGRPGVHRGGADRHAGRGRLLPARRDHAVRAAVTPCPRLTRRATRHGPGARPARLAGVLLVAGIVVMAVNLRAAITSLPPVFPELSRSLGLPPAALDLLAAVPVLCFGVFSGVATPLGRRFGEERVLGAALALLAAGLLLRGALPQVLLFPGTVLAAGAIALMNVLLGSLIKRRRADQAGLLVGLYLTAMSGGAIVASVTAVPLFDAAGGDGAGSRLVLGRVGAARAGRRRGLAAAAAAADGSRGGGPGPGRPRRRAADGQVPAGLAGDGVHGAAEPVLLRRAVLVPDHVPRPRAVAGVRRRPAGPDEPGQRDHRDGCPGARAPGQGPAGAGRGGDGGHHRGPGRVGVRARRLGGGLGAAARPRPGRHAGPGHLPDHGPGAGPGHRRGSVRVRAGGRLPDRRHRAAAARRAARGHRGLVSAGRGAAGGGRGPAGHGLSGGPRADRPVGVTPATRAPAGEPT